MAGRVIPFPSKPPEEQAPTAVELESKIHKLAENSANLRFDHPHFQLRLAQRKLTMRQILEVLRHGRVVHGPTKDEWGDWR